MAFRNPPIAGSYLVRPAIQSPNYVLGTSGWTVNRDGSSEFNAGTFRGSLAVGSSPGKRFIVNNATTGDIIDVYNSSNQLVMEVDSVGNVTTIDPSSLDQASLFGHGLYWKNQTRPPFSNPQVFAQGDNVNGNTISLNSGASKNTAWVSELTLIDSVGNSGAAGIAVFQRGTNGSGAGSIGGSLVQTDNLLPQNNVIHMDAYSGTTDGSGHLVFAHGCDFQPNGAIITGRAPSVGIFPNLTIGTDGFTSTLANFTFTVANTGGPWASQPVMFNALFFG